MPFVNRQANSPERIRHLSDQWHAAAAEFDRIYDRTKTIDDPLTPEEQEVLDRVHNLQAQLLGRPVKGEK